MRSPGRRDEGLGALLREQAEQHEPDRERILARLHSGPDVTVVHGRTPTRRPARRPASLVGMLGIAIPAVAVVAVVAGLGTMVNRNIAGLADGAPAGHTSTESPTPRVSSPADVGATRPSVPATVAPTDPGAVLPTTGDGGEDTPSSVARPSITMVAPNTPLPRDLPVNPGLAPPQLSVQVVKVGTKVKLNSDHPINDWFALGALPGGRVLHDAAPIVAFAQVVPMGRTPVTSPQGPFKVSWAGGTPIDRGKDAAGWLVVDAGRGDGFMISSPETRSATELTLYAGGVQAAVRIRAVVIVAGRPSTASVATLAANAPAGVITVRMPAMPAAGVIRVEITGSDPAAGGQVGLAAGIVSIQP